jgi:tRNA pseudouridine55 synthase
MEEETKTGFILVNKPSGPTSHDIVNKLRSVSGVKKIGHAGTLDPFASGLLIMAIGREATREIRQFVKLDKCYEAVLCLGAESNTFDRTGKIEEGRNSKFEIRINDIEKVVNYFVGQQEQIPPMFSAKKVGGKKLYLLARQGKEIERHPADIEIFEIKILEYSWPRLKLFIHCSSGTYIRSLAHDIGKRLGCGAYLEELKRTAVGRFKLTQANDTSKLAPSNWTKLLFQND